MTNLSPDPKVEARIDQLHEPGLVDMHFDMLMDLYEKRHRPKVMETDYLQQLRTGDIGVLGVAIFLENKYLPEMALRVALDQISRLYIEVEQTNDFIICKNFADIMMACQANQIALIITMEGVESLGTDLDLLRVFYELGVRSLGLTHSRRNMAADGGIFASSGSPAGGLSPFGRDLIKQCEALGIILDLAHLNPAGIEEVLAMTTGPLIISHTNPRAFYDIERNSSDAQIMAVAERGGVIGVNAVLISDQKEEVTLTRYVDHIEHIVDLAGIDNVGLGFDFFKFIIDQWPPEMQVRVGNHFPPDLHHHGHTRNVTRMLVERGFADYEIAKILYNNWLRVFEAFQLRK